MTRALPEGWAETDFGSLIASYQNGLSKRSGSSGVPVKVLRLTDVFERGIRTGDFREIRLTPEEIEKYLLAPGDLVVTRVNGSPELVGTALVFSADDDWAFCDHFIRARVISELAVPEYVKLALVARDTRRRIETSFVSSAGQKTISQGTLSSLPIRLPPLAEQRRIVEKSEALTARSGRAREALAALPALLDRYRAAVLAAAFRGDLTAEWREAQAVKHGVADEVEGPHELPDGWRWQAFGSVARVDSKLVSPADHPGAAHIAPNHIESKTGRLLPYLTVEEDKVTSPKHLFCPGHIIYSKIRPYLAKAVLVDFGGLCSADAYPISTRLPTQYLHYWMICDEFTYQASQCQGRTVLPKINKEALYALPVPVPVDGEAELIARKVRQSLNRTAPLEKLVFDLPTRLSTLDSAILAKAFRGELVPQNPTDEPASVLLERIRAERAAAGDKPKRGRRKKEEVS